MYINQGVSMGFDDHMHNMKNPDQYPRTDCIFLMTNFLKIWLDQYTISDNISELKTKLSLTFMLITSLTLA